MNGARGQTTVAVDAMGGDFAPVEVILGALEAHQQGINVILVGDQKALDLCLADLKAHLPVVHAPDVIAMHEAVTPSLRNRQSSLQVAARIVSEGQADSVVSCGNSAAIYFVAMSSWGMQPGIDRPAFGGMIPTRQGGVFVLDIGANPTVKASNLVQFATMGDVYVRLWKGIEAPRIALLSNGTEDSKGTKQVKEANDVLRKSDLNFVGNVEGTQIFAGVADVVVCDGFSGNVLLKGAEAVAMEIFQLLKEELTRDLVSRVAAGVLTPAFNRVRQHVDYQEYGGAPVLGVNGIMINCHGRSKAKAVNKAIHLADAMAKERLVDKIGEALHVDGTDYRSRRRLVRALHLRHGEG